MRSTKRAEPENLQNNLFDSPGIPQVVLDVTHEPPPPILEPRWTFQGLDDTDLITDEPVAAFLFDSARLEAAYGTYADPVFKVLFETFAALKAQPAKRLKDRAFTVYCGDVGYGYSLFGIALGLTDARVVEFFKSRFRNVIGYQELESASSSSFLPMFRYDHGFIIEYSDPEEAGTTLSLDAKAVFGAGFTLYRRAWYPTEIEGFKRSRYGKLI